VAIVVSEESGAISLALNGALERGLTADTLRTRLRTLVGRRGERMARVETRSSLA
jgi:hypothetical protein